MSGYNLGRKMKRTKREELKLIENMNRNAIEQLMKQQVELGQKFGQFVGEIVSKYNQFVAETIMFQKEVLAVRNILKARGVFTEFEIAREIGLIEERAKMEREAIIIGGRKEDPEKKEEEVKEEVKIEEKKE